MPHFRSPARRAVRRAAALLLAVLTLGMCFGEPTELVLCLEADGGFAIETPHEQAACHARQAEKHKVFLSANSVVGSEPGCVDVPLNVGHGVAASRVISPAGPANVVACHGELAAKPLDGASAPSTAFDIGATSPPSGILLCLRAVVLRI